MIARFSRRQLADFAIVRLQAGDSLPGLAKILAAGLIAKQRSGEAELLIGDIYDELERRGELAKATVISAHELSQALRTELKQSVANTAGVKQVSLEEQIDDRLIGGFQVHTSRHSWDKSVVSLLAKLKGTR